MVKLKLFIFIIIFSSVFLVAALSVYYDFFSVNYLNEVFTSTKDLVDQSYYLYSVFFFLVYFFVAAFSLPFAGVLSIFIGALFNFFDAVFIISLGASLGALVSFLFARFTLKSFMEVRYKEQFETINKGLEVNGIFYLFFLRVVPIFPFFIINILFGITEIPAKKFYLVSLIGMFPGILLYVNAGDQISKITSINDIYSFNILFSIFVIGIFPLIVKKVIYYFKLIKK